MREVTLKEIYQLASAAREEVWAKAKALGREPKIYLHWTAGWYDNKFDDYHVNIDKDGKYFVSTDNFADIVAGTYRRNSGAINITMCCAAYAATKGLGPNPPTAAQIESMALAICAVAEGLWLTINPGHVMTHGEAADNDDGLWCHEAYGPKSTCERWDLEYLETSESPKFNPWATDGSRGGDVLRGKAIWYLPEFRKNYK